MLNQIRKSIPKNILQNRIKESCNILFKKQPNEVNSVITEELNIKTKNNVKEKLRKYTKGRFLGKGGFAK